MRLRLLSAAAACLFSLVSDAFPQAPDSLADQVIMVDVYSAMGGHQSALAFIWLRPDGTSFDIARTRYGHSSNGAVNGPIETRAGFAYLYVKDTSDTARLLFPVNGVSNASGYVLTFTDAVSGTLVATAGPAMGFGTFRLRPSQFGVGPLNLSTRTMITSAGATIAGFVLPSPTPRFVLVRAIGPTLSKYGLTNNAGQIQLSVYDPDGKLIPADDWDSTPASVTTFNQLFALCGAFPLNAGGGDKCALLELPPRIYTAKMAAEIPGNGLIEVYFLP